MATCKFFANGFCARGTDCLFNHDRFNSGSHTPGRLRASAAEFQLPTRNLKADSGSTKTLEFSTPCRFLLLGMCTKGATCRFQHPSSVDNAGTMTGAETKTAHASGPISDPPAHYQAEITNLPNVKPAIPPEGTLSRKFGAAIVTFEPGAAVQQIQFASEFSAIQVSGLPTTAKGSDVQALLAGYGFTVEQETVRVKVIDNQTAVASVTVQDPCFAENAVREIQKDLARDRKAKLTVGRKPVLDETGAASNRFEMRSVSCSWYRPSRVMWLHYRRTDLAEKALERLQGKTIRGRKLDCTMQNQSRFNQRNPRSILSVQIGNLDTETKDHDVAKILGGCQPLDVVVGKKSYEIRDAEGARLVKKLLEGVGSLESWEVSFSRNATRNKGFAKFHNAEHAHKAMTTLSGNKVPQFGNSKLYVNHLISVKFTVLAEMYAAIRADVDELRERQLGSNSVHISDYQPSEPGQRLTTVKIYGEDARAVARVKSAFETILSGHILRDGDKPIWNTYFATPQGLVFLKTVHQRHDTFIYRDSRHSRLAMYGHPQKQQAVQQDILNKVSELARQTHVITLTPEQQYQALHGGFRDIVDELGKEKATLDVRQKPMTITIRGSAVEYEAALLLLNEHHETRPRPIEANSDAPDCAICWTTPDDLYTTPCGHVYCVDCFAGQCTSAADSDFPISCFGGSGTCKEVISLAALQKALRNEDFESLLEKSFKLHVQANPAIFQYCLTPDCPEIYKVSATGTVITCHSCFSQICSTCHVLSHDGLSCAENKDLQGEGNKAFKKWKQENDVRDCPRCSMPIEKSYGCNHMECKACKGHFCWLCLASFDTGPETYGHMQAKHDSFY